MVFPQAFGRYLILSKISQGGMAEVYLAKPRDRAGELVAIKCLHEKLAAKRQFVDMFVHEGQLAVMLRHPNIVRTHEVGRVDAKYFIGMEYISGQDLKSIFKHCTEQGERIPIPIALFVGTQICKGLQYAHELTDADGRFLNIVNRDVSPQNIRLSYAGDVKLIDFGIAQGMLSLQSQIGVVKGKISYMSPEQVRGMPVDQRTDVFAAGIVLFEMLSGTKLFTADSEFHLMEKVRRADVPSIKNYNARCPEAVDKVLAKALARDANDRYQTASEMGAELEQLLAPYRFDPAELREFIQARFRDDFLQEERLLEERRKTVVPAAVTAPPVAELEQRPAASVSQVPAQLEVTEGEDVDDGAGGGALFKYVGIAVALALLAIVLLYFKLR